MSDLISKYAEDLKQLYINLNNVGTLQIQKEGADFYVPLYERKLRRLKVALTLDVSTQDCFYIYGQPGSGKSTALNYFDDDNLRESYELILIKGRYLFDLQDVDIIDIMLMLALELLRRLQKKEAFEESVKQLYQQHVEKAEYMQEEAKKERTTAGVNMGLGISLSKLLNFFGIGAHTNLEAEYHLESEKRNLCRRFFNISKVDFLALINEMIAQYARENDGKKILAIWDDLEKIEKPEQIRGIFIENRNYLTDLKCKKIIITPVSLALEAKIPHQDLKEYFLGLKIKEQKCDNEHVYALEEDCQLLRKIALKRVSNENLYGEGSIEMAIRYSGGNIRQFVRLLGGACLNAYMNEQSFISIDEVQEAVSTLKKNMQPVLMGNRRLVKLLASIKENQFGCQENNDILTIALSSLFVFICQNGDWWSTVNPLIEDCINLYLDE